MCKSIAEGGARCSYHLGQQVATGQCAFAAAVTGLPRAEVDKAFEALRAEFAGRPDPSEQEVREFLEEMEFRVRHEPNLSPAKRVSIMRRFTEALKGRLHLDGATFGALKSIVAEAWSRSRRRVVAVFLAGSLAMGVGACGSTGSSPARPVAQRPVATASATPSPSAEQVQKATVVSASFTGEAVDMYGADKVQAAYAEMAAYAQKHTFDPALLRNSDPTEADFTPEAFTAEGIQMTPRMAAAWRKTVHDSLGGDATASGNVNAVCFYGLNGPGVAWRSSGPMVVNQAISNPQVSVDHSKDGPRLALSYQQAGTLLLTKDGNPVQLQASKSQTVWLVPNPDQAAASQTPWLIDGIQGHYQFTTLPNS